MPLLPENIEEAHGAALELRIVDAEFRQTLLDETRQLAHLRNAAEVALHIGHEAGNAGLTEGFGQHLQGHGFSGSGSTGDKTVPAGHLAHQRNRTVFRMGYVQAPCCIQHITFDLTI